MGNDDGSTPYFIKYALRAFSNKDSISLTAAPICSSLPLITKALCSGLTGNSGFCDITTNAPVLSLMPLIVVPFLPITNATN